MSTKLTLQLRWFVCFERDGHGDQLPKGKVQCPIPCHTPWHQNKESSWSPLCEDFILLIKLSKEVIQPSACAREKEPLRYLCHSSLWDDSWPIWPKIMRVIQAVFEFSSGIKRQDGNRTDWTELSCKIIYWQSGLHSWVKREIAKRKKKKQTCWAIYVGFWIVFLLLNEANNAPKEAFLPLLIGDYRPAWNTWKCINCSLITS